MNEADVIRAFFTAFARRDVDAAVALFDDAGTLWPQGTARRVERDAPYAGHAGIRRYFEDVAATWEEIEIRADSIRAVSGGCTVFGVTRGKPLGGPEIEVPVIWVFRLRDGLIAQAKAVATAEEAVAAHADAGKG